MHALLPLTATQPAGHCTQAPFCAKKPGMHGQPAAAHVEKAGHARQALEAVASAKKPSGHAAHAVVLPTKPLNVPMPQGTHRPCDIKWPIAHACTQPATAP